MTRQEFIDQYLVRSRMEAYRTITGYRIGNQERIAVKCACGDELCPGWAMVPPDAVEAYRALYGD